MQGVANRDIKLENTLLQVGAVCGTQQRLTAGVGCSSCLCSALVLTSARTVGLSSSNCDGERSVFMPMLLLSSQAAWVMPCACAAGDFWPAKAPGEDL
jgi:hypothetical protein